MSAYQGNLRLLRVGKGLRDVDKFPPIRSVYGTTTYPSEARQKFRCPIRLEVGAAFCCKVKEHVVVIITVSAKKIAPGEKKDVLQESS